MNRQALGEPALDNRHRYQLRLAIAGLVGLSLAYGGATAIAQPPNADIEPDAEIEEEIQFLRPPMMCPDDVETLVDGLLRDLPDYANRVATRSLGISEDIAGFGTVLIAGRAEFEPLDIDAQTFGGAPTITADEIQQVFFTTLERQYTPDNFVNLEQYHWLFLTQGEDGWRMALLFSRTAPAEATVRPPTPPRENSDGIVGQAVRLWLRDCRAGALYPIETEAEAEAEIEP
jgi:hypothetical protein